MKCPHCEFQVKWPHIRDGDYQGSVSVWGRCPSCSGKITYSFSGEKMCAYAIPMALICWLASMAIGDVSYVFFPVMVLIPAMRLEKYY